MFFNNSNDDGTIRAANQVCISVHQNLEQFHKAIKEKGKIPPRVTIDEVKKARIWTKAFFMFIAEIATGICGLGSGIYYMPVFKVLGHSMHIAIDTSSTEMVFVAEICTANLTLHGYVRWFYFASIGIVTLIFSWLEAKATKTVKAWVLIAMFGVLIGFIGLSVAFGVI